ncbi:MAG: response regulator [Myxococcales bacterium]|nr:response regulator [Myxococcales bacterium]
MSQQNARILIVDDEPLILSTYERTLKDVGDLRLAHSPSLALEMLEQEPVDVVVADYRMPRMNGDAFLEVVRARWPETVRMLVTAYTDVEIVEATIRRGGIFRFLNKPCHPRKLKQALREGIAEARRARETNQRSRKLELDLQGYRELFTCNADVMMVADLEGYIVEANAIFDQLYGDSGADALRNRPHVLTDPLQRGRWAEIRETIEREGRFVDETEHDGRQNLLSISAITSNDGKTYAYAASERDVTERYHLQNSARAAQYEVIYALAKLAEYRDPETGAHLERMRRYSQIIARHLATTRYRDQFDDKYVEAIYFSSPLHDIGKVGIPDAVLLKPGRLTDAEREVMQTHTLIGAEVLSATGDTLAHRSWLALARTIALEHHEKFDGSGYPNGIGGEEIDIAARIVALADAYDAITSKRVYKDALSHETARDRILESCGSHFDPDVVASFLACEREFIRVKETFCDVEGVFSGGSGLRLAVG